MATYVVPQVQVFEEFETAPQARDAELPAHISGGNAHLIRHSVADEKSEGSLGSYDRLNDEAHDWPARPAGGVVDADYTKVFIENALLQYYSHSIGVGDTLSTVAGATNRIRAAATIFKSGNDEVRDDVLLDRDVKVGDFVTARAVVSSVQYELNSYVAGFVAEIIAASVGAASSDSDNQASTSAANSGGQVTGPFNCVDITSISHTLYDGLEDGNVTETYTILVTKSSVGGDGTTAQLRIRSASGNDDLNGVSPAAFGSPSDIGTRGATVTFHNTHGATCSVSAVDQEVDDDDFVAGQSWVVTVTQDFTPAAATEGGTYTGAVDTTYIVEVTRGGTYAGTLKPQITVTTDKGIDASGPHLVTAAATDVNIGIKGVTVAFDATSLRKGDRYYIPVTAETKGAIQTIILGNNFPSEVIDNGETEVDLDLFIRKTIEVTANRTGEAPLTNWEQSETELTLKSGIVAFDETWTEDGVPVSLPVWAASTYGKVYVEARYWLSTLCNTVDTLIDISGIEAAIPGPLDPDNPLKWGVYKALQNSNGTGVRFTSVCDPNDVDSWARVLELIDGRRDTYNLVPLTRNAVVLGLFEAHCNDSSSPNVGRWRTAWFNLAGIPEKVITNAALSTDGEEILAVLEDDPDTSGTQYTLLRVPGNTGLFATNDVQPGDIVRYLYTTDGFDNAAYTEFVVDEVINEDTIRLLVGNAVAINTPQKIEVWRNLTATHEAEELAKAGGFSNRRIKQVWPDTVGQDGYTVPGYFLCCCLAGLASGVVPQQGLTHVEVAGCDNLDRTVLHFNRTQLDVMAGGGVWVVTQDLQSGAVLTRHAVTTGDTDDINMREEMVTRNLDSIAFFMQDIYAPYIGVANMTPGAIAMIEAETKTALKYLVGRSFVSRLGGQLIDGQISQMRAHATLKDRLVVGLRLLLPYPMNNIECHLLVVA